MKEKKQVKVDPSNEGIFKAPTVNATPTKTTFDNGSNMSTADKNQFNTSASSQGSSSTSITLQRWIRKLTIYLLASTEKM